MCLYYYLVGALAYAGLQELSGVRVGWDGMDHTNAMWTTLWYHLVTA